MGSYYNRPWSGAVEVWCCYSDIHTREARDFWESVQAINSVEAGLLYVAQNLFDVKWRIVDAGGNIYETGDATAVDQ